MSLDIVLFTRDKKTGVDTQHFEGNITHNLGEMAQEAGIYQCLWRHEELGITKASQVAKNLAPGFIELLRNRKKYEAFNPDNGWGDYDGLCDFCYKYIRACYDNPKAKIWASR